MCLSVAGFKGSSHLIQQCCEVGAVTVFIVFIFIFNKKTDSSVSWLAEDDTTVITRQSEGLNPWFPPPCMTVRSRDSGPHFQPPPATPRWDQWESLRSLGVCLELWGRHRERVSLRCWRPLHFQGPRSLTTCPGKRFHTFIGLVLASVSLPMGPEPQCPRLCSWESRRPVEWESRLSETPGRCPMGYPLPILKDTSRTSQS